MVAVPQRPPTQRRRCSAERADGEPCRGFVLRGSLFCHWHEPDRRLDREEALERRARQRAPRPKAPAPGWLLDLDTPAQLRAFTAEALRATRDGQLAPDVATATFYGVAVLARLLRRRGRRGGRP